MDDLLNPSLIQTHGGPRHFCRSVIQDSQFRVVLLFVVNRDIRILPEEHQNHRKIRKTSYDTGENELDVRQRHPSIGRKD